MAYVGNNPKFITSTLRPQSADPSNPTEGMLQYSDGTARSEGVWVYTNSAWSLVGSGAASQNHSYLVSNLGIAASVGSSALTIAIKTSAGSDATAGDKVSVAFRNATAATGQFSLVDITGALSLVISSGSTLGQISAVSAYIYVYLINNAGTAELAVSRVRYDDGSIISTTAEGGAGGADSASTIYSSSSRSNVAIRLVGRLLNTQATAGTWATAPSEISVLPFLTNVVSAKYTTNAAQAVVGGNIVDFEDRVYDTHNAVTTGASWKFTSPKTAKYHISCHLRTDNVAASVGNLFGIDMDLDGVSSGFGTFDVCENTGSRAYASVLNTTLTINAGSYIDIRFSENLPAVNLINSGNYEYICIEEVP